MCCGGHLNAAYLFIDDVCLYTSWYLYWSKFLCHAQPSELNLCMYLYLGAVVTEKALITTASYL
jgi:hypothetical protein